MLATSTVIMYLAFMNLGTVRSVLRMVHQPVLDNGRGLFLTASFRNHTGHSKHHSVKDAGDQHPDPAIERLFRKNRAWVERVNNEDPTFFPELGKGQSPDYLYIGCSDSRVAVNDLTGVEMGELFVHRNIANMVVSSDLNLLAVLSYAVDYLKVRHILVTGHYDCGGVRAAVQKQGKGQILDAWLQNIRDVYRLHKKELDNILDDELRHRRLVELNVMEQCLNLYKTSIVQRRRLETYNDDGEPMTVPRVHGLVFDPATGILSKVTKESSSYYPTVYPTHTDGGVRVNSTNCLRMPFSRSCFFFGTPLLF